MLVALVESVVAESVIGVVSVIGEVLLVADSLSVIAVVLLIELLADVGEPLVGIPESLSVPPPSDPPLSPHAPTRKSAVTPIDFVRIVA
jgi:hypothetical protein